MDKVEFAKKILGINLVFYQKEMLKTISKNDKKLYINKSRYCGTRTLNKIYKEYYGDLNE